MSAQKYKVPAALNLHLKSSSHETSLQELKNKKKNVTKYCACHEIYDLQIQCACQRICNVHNPLRLPRILQIVRSLAPVTQNDVFDLQSADFTAPAT